MALILNTKLAEEKWRRKEEEGGGGGGEKRKGWEGGEEQKGSFKIADILIALTSPPPKEQL